MSHQTAVVQREEADREQSMTEVDLWINPFI